MQLDANFLQQECRNAGLQLHSYKKRRMACDNKTTPNKIKLHASRMDWPASHAIAMAINF